MSRNRTKNRGLPRRVYLQHGAYRFFSPEAIRNPSTGKMQKWIHLAYEHEGESAMLLALGHLFADKRTQQGSMPFVCAEFKANKLGRYGRDTQAQYSQYLGVTSDDFEDFHVAQVTTKACADFLRSKFKGKPNTAQKYAALMRKLFKYVISELGIRHDNPMDQLDLSDYETNRRTELPTHDQVQQIREWGMKSKPRSDTGKSIPTASGPMFCCIIDMTYLCWQRAIDVRMLKESQIEDGRIRFTPKQNGQEQRQDRRHLHHCADPDGHRRGPRDQEEIRDHQPLPVPDAEGQAVHQERPVFDVGPRPRACRHHRLGMVQDLRALGATDAAKAGTHIGETQTRLAHTSSKTSEIYIKESVPETSGIDLKLPWKSV
jgi:hypothetical protein